MHESGRKNVAAISGLQLSWTERNLSSHVRKEMHIYRHDALPGPPPCCCSPPPPSHATHPIHSSLSILQSSVHQNLQTLSLDSYIVYLVNIHTYVILLRILLGCATMTCDQWFHSISENLHEKMFSHELSEKKTPGKLLCDIFLPQHCQTVRLQVSAVPLINRIVEKEGVPRWARAK